MEKANTNVLWECCNSIMLETQNIAKRQILVTIFTMWGIAHPWKSSVSIFSSCKAVIKVDTFIL